MVLDETRHTSSTASTDRPDAVAAASATGPRPRSDLLWVAGLFVLALAARLAFVLIVDRTSMGFNDARFYHGFADSLVDGDGYARADGTPTAQWPPGFSFVLSLVYRFTGPDPLAGEVMNAVLGALTVPLLYVATLRAFGRRAALVAAGWLAVMPGPILWADVLFSETLYAFAVVAVFALLATLPARWWSVLVLGLVIGGAALVRGEGLFLVVPVVVAWWRTVGLRNLALRTVGLGAAVVLAVAPWTIRNYAQLDAFVPISSNVGATFWAGHNPSAYGGPTYYGNYDRFSDDVLERELESSRYLRGEAFDYLFSHPLEELGLIPRKLINLNRGDSEVLVPINGVQGGDEPPLDPQATKQIGVVADVFWYSLLAVTIASVALWGRRLWRQPVGRAAMAFIATSLVLYGFLYFGSYRYRFPLEPLMIMLSAPLVASIWSRRRELDLTR
jgi:4-amino-4-deoxy-L-arabinose transferase-like glycosyltransferase